LINQSYQFSSSSLAFSWVKKKQTGKLELYAKNKPVHYAKVKSFNQDALIEASIKTSPTNRMGFELMIDSL